MNPSNPPPPIAFSDLQLWSSREVTNGLARMGCYPGKTKRSSAGSHQMWYRDGPDGKKVGAPVVLGKREIPKTTLKNILQGLRITAEEFRAVV